MAAATQIAIPRISGQARWALLVIGGTGVVAQIVLLRELLSLFQGNELSIGVMLAIWLLGTALGSTVLGRLSAGMGHRRALVASLQATSAVAFFLAIAVIRYSKVIVPAIAGEVLGPGRMFLTSAVALALFCPISGMLFACAGRWYMQETAARTADGTSYAYMLESLGAALAGLVASVVLLPYFSSFQITLLVAAANALLVVWLLCSRRVAVVFTFFVLAGSTVIFPSMQHWEIASLAGQWPAFRLVEARTSKYGSLAVLDSEGSRSLAESGTILFTSPDPESAEEAVHFALLQHPNPRSVLLLGGGVNGSAAQVMRHPSVERLDYVELDPVILALSAKRFVAEWAPLEKDRRVRIHALDGRAFLHATGQKFDVIILNLPEPRTAQLNRFYTREFFADARAALNPGGIFGLQLRAAENYISPPRAAFLQCIHRTLRESFPEIAVVPGDILHFLASVRPGQLVTDAGVLTRRIQERRLPTQYVREYFLPFRLTPERIADLTQQIAPLPHTPVNQDFAPVAYYLDLGLWSAHFDPSYAGAFFALARVRYLYVVLAVMAGVVLCWAGMTLLARRRRVPAAAGAAVMTMGMTMLALEIFLLLGFQAVYGYVFHQLAIIIAGFMLGLAAGSWLGLRLPWPEETVLSRAMAIQLAAAVMSMALCATLLELGHIRDPHLLSAIAHAGFPLLAAACGAIGGLQFPLLSRLFFVSGGERNAGMLYGLDLLGSCVGALAVSVWLIPVFGLVMTALLVALANVGAAAIMLAASGRGVALRQRIPAR